MELLSCSSSQLNKTNAGHRFAFSTQTSCVIITLLFLTIPRGWKHMFILLCHCYIIQLTLPENFSKQATILRLLYNKKRKRVIKVYEQWIVLCVTLCWHVLRSTFLYKPREDEYGGWPCYQFSWCSLAVLQKYEHIQDNPMLSIQFYLKERLGFIVSLCRQRSGINLGCIDIPNLSNCLSPNKNVCIRVVPLEGVYKGVCIYKPVYC